MALGIAFGLFMSLTLKHSYLAQFPKIESCLVALCAYTCYFFSNGLSMSGIVSLLFCGITLKHYAYHIMSRRTQRASKYIFATLARLAENFIFIYLGLSLFTSPPSGSKLTSYFKPLFIIISTVAVIFVRYASVFPLSEAINLFQRHVRGQRQDEIPYSYQMMLFWAGLRGAVGVALAAGFQGEHAQIMRTTVLVVVVLTVVIFGGTTARMLEVLNIRTGVEDDAGALSSDEEDPSAFLANGLGGPGGRRGSFDASPWGRYRDTDDDLYPLGRAAGYNHQPQNARVFSASSSDSYDSDAGEVLPLASTSTRTQQQQQQQTSLPRRSESAQSLSGLAGEGKWFQALDERYLLPLFSNATASRTFHARKQQRRAAAGAGASGRNTAQPSSPASPSGHLGGGGSGGVGGTTPVESEDEGERERNRERDRERSGRTSRSGSGAASPWLGTARGQRVGSPALRSPREHDR